MYQLSLYSYKVKNTETEEVFQQNNGSPADIIYNEWLNLGNNPEFLQYFADELAEIETANVMLQLRDVLGVVSRQALLISMNRNGYFKHALIKIIKITRNLNNESTFYPSYAFMEAAS